jgi:DNA-binding XRE family transcriptional regulator
MADLIDAPPALNGCPSICHSALQNALVLASTASAAAQRWFVVADGRRLRQLRRQHGLSQAVLAGRAGISVTTIGRLERHARPSCRGRTLARITAALGEHPTALIPPPSRGAGNPIQRP